jgi:hypothetical protein
VIDEALTLALLSILCVAPITAPIALLKLRGIDRAALEPKETARLWTAVIVASLALAIWTLLLYFAHGILGVLGDG